MSLLKKLFGGEMEMEEIQGEQDEPAAGDQESAAERAGDDNWPEEGGELAIDMYQTKDAVIIKSTIAGVKPEDLDITVASDMVAIKGERRQEQEIKHDDYFYQECYWGSFSRAVQLPVEINVEKVDADIKDGVLTLTLPKSARSKTKKVKVKSE